MGAAGRSTLVDSKVVSVAFAPLAERRSVLDRAHRGDIEGALGRVRSCDTGPRRTLRNRLATLLGIMGPGIVVMVADNDAGGLSLYAQAGQDHGLGLLWLLMLLAPVLFVTQEMVARLGAVTGAGHARLIFERFGRRWGYFALGDLLVVNLLTLITQFIGVALALGYFGVSRYVSVPLAAVVLVGVTGSGSFRRWERAMYALVAVSLAAVPLAVLGHLGDRPVSAAAEVSTGGLHGDGLLFVIALVGTTVAPWQLFFHQSNVVDKRITPRWMGYERADTAIGTALFCLGAVGVLLACAAAFSGTPMHGAFVDAGHVAEGLRSRVGDGAGALLAIVLLNGSVLGAAAVTLSTSYAVGDSFGVRHSLHRPWRQARVFHGSFVLLVALAAGIVLAPGAPLGVATIGVHALAGVLLPSATVFLLLLCNDSAVLGPWTNPRWLNVIAAGVVGVLIELSALLTVTTLFPDLNVPLVATALTAVLVAAFTSLAVNARRGRADVPPPVRLTRFERAFWTMPPLDRLAPPPRSWSRTIALIALRAYLVFAAALVLVKFGQLMVAA